MATKNWPSAFTVETVDYGIDFDVQIQVMRNGRVYTYELPGARWTVTIGFGNDFEMGQRPAVEALLTSLKGGANRLALGHLGRKYPNGTLRGSPTLNGAHAMGAEQLSLSNCNGTLKRGDIVGVPGQILMVVDADYAPDGSNHMTVNVSPPLFSGYASGAPLTWNQPTTLWIPKSASVGPFPFMAGQSRPAFSVDLVESGV